MVGGDILHLLSTHTSAAHDQLTDFISIPPDVRLPIIKGFITFTWMRLGSVENTSKQNVASCGRVQFCMHVSVVMCVDRRSTLFFQTDECG